MVTPLGVGSPAQRLRASPSSGSRPVAGRTARWQVDEEQDWPLTAPHGRPRPRVLQGFPGTPRCEGALSSDPCAHLPLPRAICCILEIWMDYYQEDFCRLPQSASLKKILEFIRQRMPGTDVELRARRYLQQLRRLHAAEPEAGASARAKDPEALPEPAPAPTVGPAASDGLEVLEAALAAGAEGLAPAEVPAGEAKPLQIAVTALDHGCALDEPRAPAATPEEEQALAPAIGVPRVPEPPIASGTTGFNLCAAP
ncbi:uncharacterized protein AAEQ78_019386 isoform 1-T2 [Lycaon pictus]